jgi:Cu-Zn family superoxide dismutase
MKLMTIALFGTALIAGCAGMSSRSTVAEAVMNPTKGNAVNGKVQFEQKDDQLIVTADLHGLTPGSHGFHIHEKGDCSAPDASSAGGHFNPGKTHHGDPLHGEHHGGDFGNLVADANGNAAFQLSVPASQINLALDTPNSIIGKGLIVHADPDDYVTQPTGNSGKRVACGVITLK